MRDEAVTLHLAHTQAAVPRAALARLPGQRDDRPPPPAVHLVDDHVLEALVVRRPDKDFHGHHFSRHSIVHHLVAVGVQPEVQQVLPQVLEAQMVVGRAVAERAPPNADAAVHCLQKLGNGHARGNGVRVHDNVGPQPAGGKRHVALVENHAARALLAGARGKLVPDLRNALADDSDLDERVSVRVLVLPHAVDAGGLAALVRRGQVSIHKAVRIALEVHDFADDDVILLNDGVLGGNAVFLHGRVRGVLVAPSVFLSGLGEALLSPAGHVAVLLVFVDRIVEAPHKAPVQRAPIENDRVLLIVARVAGDGYDGVGAGGHGLHVENRHDFILDDRAHRRAENVAVLVDALVVV